MRGICGVLIVIVVSAVGPSPAWAQPETVGLFVKGARGDVLQYASTATALVTLNVLTIQQRSEARTEAREVHRILESTGDGTILVEVVLEEFKTTLNGRAEESLDEPWILRVAANGRVIDPGPDRPQDYPIPLPDRPVGPGASWTRQVPLTEEGLTGQMTTTFTLESVDRTRGMPVAKIRSQIRGSVTGIPSIPLPSGTQSQTRGTVRGGGEIEWAIDQGRLLSLRSEFVADVTAEVTGGAETVAARVTMRLTNQVQPLPPERLIPTSVSPDLLVIPGKGIGDLTLGLSIPEITAKLGQPNDTQPGEGSRAGWLSWRDRALLVYVDPSDANRMLGLSVGHRRYRTDKGVGFGSSEGAALLGHGTPPATVEVMIPDVGGMRYLIYNDLGIAFGITADRQHAARGPSHAPLGSVDVVTVFPPGDAAKVLPMP